MQTSKDYLGDAVYVEMSENGMIKLTTSNGLQTLDTIFLEPAVFHSLIRWVKELPPPISQVFLK
jgi:hypothetical protein